MRWFLVLSSVLLPALCLAEMCSGLRFEEETLKSSEKLEGINFPAGTHISYRRIPGEQKLLKSAVLPKAAKICGVALVKGDKLLFDKSSGALVMQFISNKEQRLDGVWIKEGASVSVACDATFGESSPGFPKKLRGVTETSQEYSQGKLTFPVGSSLHWYSPEEGAHIQDAYLRTPHRLGLFSSELPSGTTIMFYASGAPQLVYASYGTTEEISYGGHQCLLWNLMLYEDGSLKECTLAGEETIQGLKVKGTVGFYSDGSLASGTLAYPQERQDLFEGELSLYPNGAVKRGSLVGKKKIRGLWVQGVIGMTQGGQPLEVHLVEEQVIDGISLVGWTLFHESGKLQFVTLAREQEIQGFFLEGNVKFSASGQVTEGVLSRDQTIFGRPLKAGMYVSLEPTSP